MFPGIYGFAWDTGRIVFLGAFYAVVAVVFATLGRAVVRAALDLRGGRVDSMRWHGEFEDLPAAARRCRHELSGEVARRTCDHGFDCRSCAAHARFAAAHGPGVGAAPDCGSVAGLEVPADRMYHRGHTWARDERDGTLTVGLDDLGARLLGTCDDLELPSPGARLAANGVAWRARRNGVRVRVLAPLDGEVVEVGGPGQGWILRVRPDGAAADVRNLLTPAEARPWMLREAERLQIALADETVGAALADGGVPAADLGGALSAAELDAACAAVFLEP